MSLNCIVLFIFFGSTAALDVGDRPIYGRDFVRAQPVRRVEPPERIEPKRNVLDLLLGRRATCTVGHYTCTSTGTCCSVIYDTCCSDGTCNTYSDVCCLGGGSCYGRFEKCCGPYRCAPTVGVCCGDGESHCNIGDCYLLEGVMQCCTTSRCSTHFDPTLDFPAVGAPPDLIVGTITPFPDTPEPAPTIYVAITKYYYTHITWSYYSYYFTIVYSPPTTSTTSTRITTSTYVSVQATDSSDAAYQFRTLSDEVATTPDEALSPVETSGTPIKTTARPTSESTTWISDINSIPNTQGTGEPSDNSGSDPGVQIIECVGRASITETCTTRGAVAAASASSTKSGAVSMRRNIDFINFMALDLVIALFW